MIQTTGKAFDPRAAAARVIVAVVQGGRFLDTALTARLADAGPINPRSAALAQELAYGTLRWFHQLSGIARVFLERPLKRKDQDVHALLLVGLYQLRHMNTAPHAAVSETVSAAEALGKPWAKALINACMRAVLREPRRVKEQLAAEESVTYSHPDWLIRQLRELYPSDWRDVLEANNQRPPLTLRVNAAKTTRARYLERLRQAGIAAHAVEAVDSGVVLAEPIPVADIPGFADGEVFVQDAAAQLAAVLLDAQPGERILDACAAPGGKATHILERCQNIGALIALERDARRLPRLRQNLRRSIAKAWVIVSDAAANCLTPEYFDRILLDVPCSATGVIRRHPDIKVRRGPGEIEQLVQTQAAILSGVWPCLKPGGKLLYVTCSVLKAENVDQIARFLKRHGDARESELVIPSARRQTFGYQILPGDSEMDGFYYACMEKH